MPLKIKEIAKLAGVSPSTVSRVLNERDCITEQTRQKVLNVIKETDYHPNGIAKSLKVKSTKLICLLLPNIQNPAYAPITKGVEDEARENGYTVVLCNTAEDPAIEKNYIDKMQSLMIDGFISCAVTGKHSYLTRVKNSGVPVVLCARYNREDVGSFEICSIDNFRASRLICNYLLDRGYHKVALALGNESIMYSQERYRGYRQALSDHGIEFDESLVMHFDKSNSDFYRKTIALIESGKDFDSIFCTSDGKALYVMRALHQCGYRIPEDVGVIGFDNIDVSAMTQPPLTTVSQQPYEGGRVACKALIRQIEFKRKYGILPPAEFHEMEPQLIIRQSTK